MGCLPRRGEDLNPILSGYVSETSILFAVFPEVDVSALNIGSDELYAEPMSDVEPFKPFHELALYGRIEQANPRALFGCAGYDGIEPLSDPRLEQYRRCGFPDLTLDLLRRVLLLRAMLRER